MKSKIRFLSLTLVSLVALTAFVQAGPPEARLGSHHSNARAGARPSRTIFGTYPVLTNSMNSGQVRSIYPENVQSYGTPYVGTYNNKTYWMVPVQFGRLAPIPRDGFGRGHGLILSDAVACVSGNRVEYWIYKNSSIQVP
jgi:hypothetical protein